MKTLIIYYSYTGHTKKLAQKMAEKETADLFEVLDKKKHGTVGAYVLGCFAAMRNKKTPIQPISIELDNYEKITIMAPIWAGSPAPAINSVLSQLPIGKSVELIMVSGSGSSKCKDRLKEVISNKGCKLINFKDVKGSQI